MKIQVENHQSGASKIYEGSVDQVDTQLAKDFPHLAQDVDPALEPDQVRELYELLEAIDSSQNYSVTVLEGAPVKPVKASGPESIYDDPWVREGDLPDKDLHRLVETKPMLGRERK